MGDFYYRRNAEKALQGMMGLSLEERGAYNTVLDLIYATRNRLRDDDEYMKRQMGCDVRIWKRLRARLLDHGKIYIDDGFIKNRAADDEIIQGVQKVIHRLIHRTTHNPLFQDSKKRLTGVLPPEVRRKLPEHIRLSQMVNQ